MKSFTGVAMKLDRFARMLALMSSKTEPSIPSGLSRFFGKPATIVPTSATFATFPAPYRDR